MPELDTLRGLAVLLVLLFHEFGFQYGLTGLTGLPRIFVAVTLTGWVGVNLFFVLSGFLITGILLDTRERPDYYRRFYFHRALRILPLYYATLILLVILSRSHLIARPASWPFLGLSFVFLANVTELFGVPMQYGVLWSLAVEEHFYLIWPTATRLLARRRLTFLAGVICVGCPVIRAIYYWCGYHAPSGYTWLCADGLAFGAVMAILVRSPWCSRHRLKQVAIALLAGGLTLLSLRLSYGGSLFLSAVFRETTVDLLFVGLLPVTLLAGTSKWNGIVNRPVLQFFGRISYGVYLIHMLVFELLDQAMSRLGTNVNFEGKFGMMLARFCLGATIVGVAAYLSRRYYEEPFLQLKARLNRSQSPTSSSALHDKELRSVLVT
jgi:peptidoglycan/LPS O-acetylase OafA/YrhL